jgi:hypothetical protein
MPTTEFTFEYGGCAAYLCVKTALLLWRPLARNFDKAAALSSAGILRPRLATTVTGRAFRELRESSPRERLPRNGRRYPNRLAIQRPRPPPLHSRL